MSKPRTVGILTFHWASNYGAVLQSYALQTTLQRMGLIVKIVDYRPSSQVWTVVTILRTMRPWLWFRLFNELRRDRALEPFRERYLLRTKRYASAVSCEEDPPSFDVFVAGSDQVWNPFFLLSGENGVTPLYFLHFAPAGSARVAYAVSLGVSEYPSQASSIASEYVKDFHAIGVRERSGLDVLKQWGRGDAVQVPDPTVLLDPSHYRKLLAPSTGGSSSVFIFLLRSTAHSRREVHDMVSGFRTDMRIDDCSNNPSVEEWLSSIAGAQLVVTNSYHAVVFAVLFCVPFVVLAPAGHYGGANDRFDTFLSELALEAQMVRQDDRKGFYAALRTTYDWPAVHVKLREMRRRGLSFLSAAVGGAANGIARMTH